jgi:hypothetical protein
MVLRNSDNLVKGQKSKLFTSVFCIWCLVFLHALSHHRFHTKYQTRNTKHLMNSTFHEFINSDFYTSVFSKGQSQDKHTKNSQFFNTLT